MLPSSSNISVKDYDTDVLFNYCCHTFSGTPCNICQVWTKCKPTQYLIDKAILGKTGEAYVTCVADVDKGQLDAVTLLWPFK